MKRITPSQVKEQAVKDLLSGVEGELEGKELLSELIRRSTEHVLQRFLEEEQTAFLGRRWKSNPQGSAGAPVASQPDLQVNKGLTRFVSLRGASLKISGL